MPDDSGEAESDRVINVHTHIGEREGVILEVRPKDHEHPHERDMSHLTDEEARQVRDELTDYLSGEESHV